MRAVPEEFEQLTLGFYRGTHLEHDTYQDWIRFRISVQPTNVVQVVKPFLDDVLQTSTEEELQALWRSGSSDYLIGNARLFLTDIRDEMARVLSAPKK